MALEGRLYAIAVCAKRTGRLAETAMGVQSIMMFLPENVPADRAGVEAARSVFPWADGWRDHAAYPLEVTQDFALDDYKLKWDVRRGR